MFRFCPTVAAAVAAESATSGGIEHLNASKYLIPYEPNEENHDVGQV